MPIANARIPISRLPTGVRNVVPGPHNNNAPTPAPAVNDASISLEQSVNTDFSVLEDMEQCAHCSSFNARNFTVCGVCNMQAREPVVHATRRNNYVVPENVVAPPARTTPPARVGMSTPAQRAAAAAADRAAAEAAAVAAAADAAEAAAGRARLTTSGFEIPAELLNNDFEVPPQARAAEGTGEATENGFEKTGYSRTLKCFASTAAGEAEGHEDRILLPATELQPIMDNRCMDLVNSASQEQLPVFFELENTEWKARTIVAGLKEFTAPNGTAVLPGWMMQQLYLAEGDYVKLTSVKLPRATSVKFKPVRSFKGTKAVLEQELSLHYTTLTQDTTIAISDGQGKLVELIVQELQPARSCYILGAELSVEFDEPAESQAEENKVISLNEPVSGEVAPNQYVYYEVKNNSSLDEKQIVFELEALSGDPDLFVSQQTAHPSIIANDWSAMLSGGERIVVKPTDPLRKKNSFWVSVRGHIEACSFRLACFVEDVPTTEEALESSGIYPMTSVLSTTQEAAPGPDFLRCATCNKWVPEQSFYRHEAFCKRSILKCPICSALIQTAQKDMHNHCATCQLLVDPANHVHCAVCHKGMSKGKMAQHAHCNLCPTAFECKPDQLKKHAELMHANSIACECGKLFDLETLKMHAAYDCDLLPQKCRFCDGEFPRRALAEHETRCGAETVRCAVCTVRLPRAQLSGHMTNHTQ